MSSASRMPSLLLVLVFCLPYYPSSASSLLWSSTNGASSNSELSVNQTLISEGNVFQFGFSTLPNSDGRLYLGIWYYNITPLTFVWIANRDRPFSDAAVTARLLPNGELKVQNSTSGLLWSSNSTSAWGNYTAQLGRNGNLQIHSGAGASNGSLLWQSFDHPTETFLPDMSITLDRTTGTKTVFQSWSTPEDPTPGSFTLQLDTGSMNQLLIMRKNIDGDGDSNGSESKWWRSGPWNGRYFNGINRMQPLGIYGFQFVPDPDNTLNFDKFQLGFKSSNITRQMRFVLLPNGTETTYVLENGSWNTIWSQPLTNCETYGYCGANTNCVDGASNNDTKCECLHGFSPKSEVEWNSRNWSGGCVRRTDLGCLQNSSGDDFWQLVTMKLPDSADGLLSLRTTNETECRGICSTNCSCKAYAFMPEQGCFTWSGDLVDAFQFADGRRVGDTLYVKLARSEFDTGKRNKTNMVVAVVVPLVGCLILLFCLALCLKCKSRLNVLWKKGQPDASVVDTAATSGEQVDYSNRIDIPEDVPSDGKGFELPMYTFDCIEMATDNFSESNTLGKGGFGHVYKGKLPEGDEVAVKRLSKDSNKSLDDFIFNPAKQPLLDWKKRFNIIEGVARGLLYLHRDSRLRIVHRDPSGFCCSN